MLIWVAGSSHLIVCAGVIPMLHSSVVLQFPKVQQLDLEQQSIRAGIRHWLQTLMLERNLSAIALAKLAGVSPTTIYRALDIDGEFMPTTKTLEKIASKTGKPPPSLQNDHYLPTDHLIPKGGLEPAMLKNLTVLTRYENAGLVYRVTDRTLELEGYLPGDIVIIDREVQPKAGDIVAAEIPASRSEAGNTVLRLYEPPYLMARSHDRRLEPLPILLDRSVNILGTATNMIREMRKAS